MNSRERVLAALNHQEPDRVPIDFGSTVFTGITAAAYERLKEYLKIKGETKYTNLVFQIAEVDEQILEKFNVDTRGMVTKNANGWIDTFDNERKYIDEFGITWQQPKGCPHMEIVSNPLSGDNFDFKIMEDHKWPDGKDSGRYAGLKERVKKLRTENKYASILNVYGGFVTISHFLRGYEDWLMDIALRPSLIEELLDRTLKFQIDSAKAALESIDYDIDIVAFADDYATQDSLMISPDYYKKYIKPRQEKLFKIVKDNCNAKILFHSCGAISETIDDLIEIGVDAINPVQVKAKGMNPVELKRRFGDRITFWGGIDTQHVMPNGSIAEVKEEVNKRIKELNINGGYVFNSVHTLQHDVPPENIVSMFQEAVEHKNNNISCI